MKMERLYASKALMSLIVERYRTEKSHSQLLEVVLNTKKFQNTSEQGSNALTLLSKMNFTFTNLNFDDVSAPDADLSNSVFYSCSFRNANLDKAILYKTQIISCHI